VEFGDFSFFYLLVLLAAILADVGVILIWRSLRRQRRERRDDVLSVDLSSSSSDTSFSYLYASISPRQIWGWVVQRRREVAVAAALLLILGYVWVATPRPLNSPSDELQTLSRPLDGLRRVAEFLEERAATWARVWPFFAAFVLIALGVWGWRSKQQRVFRVGAFLALLSVAIEGQLLLQSGNILLAAAAYGLAALVSLVWIISRRRTVPEEEPVERRIAWPEAALLVAIVALAAFARFYAMPRVAYGIEGDESKWTIEVVSVMLDAQHTIQSEYHYTTQPASFYMQAPFHHLLGPSVLSARIAVATYSLLATLAFYWLVRQTLGPPVALLSTFLLAISLVDVSASRLALVESHVKLWAVLGLAFLAHGLRARRAAFSLLAGVALAIGLLTYDTFLPMIGVALVWSLISLAAGRATVREWATHLTALLVPVLIVAPFVVEYLMGRMEYYNPGRLDWNAAPFQVLWHNLELIVQNFWAQTYGDFLFVRSGPIVNGVLVPFLLIGVVLASIRIRRPGYALPLLWFALVFLPVPVIAGSPYVRVFYPGFPAIYVLVAVAALMIWRELVVVLPKSLRPALVALAVVTCLGLLVGNLYIYFNDLDDPFDRQLRRELVDMVTEAVAPGRRVYAPYFPESGDAVEFERELMALAVRRKLTPEQIPQYLWSGPYDEFLPTLAQEGVYFDSLAFVVNRTVDERREEREVFVETLRRCLGTRQVRQGMWVDLYVVDAPDIAASRCVVPRVGLEMEEAGTGGEWRWWMEDAAGPAEAHLTCWQLRPETVVVEAEDMQAENRGWHEDRRFVTGFRGRGYLADVMTVNSAHITVTVPVSGTYDLWVRTLRRSPDDYPFLLSVDGRAHTFLSTEDEPTFEWIWRQAGPLDLDAGVHTLRVARPIQEWTPGTLALFVDTVILSGDGAFDPQEDSEWVLYAERHAEVSPHSSSGTFDMPIDAPGDYRCFVTLTDGDRLIDWDGSVGARSNEVHLAVPFSNTD
jgi:hypothetical protein